MPCCACFSDVAHPHGGMTQTKRPPILPGRFNGKDWRKPLDTIKNPLFAVIEISTSTAIRAEQESPPHAAGNTVIVRRGAGIDQAITGQGHRFLREPVTLIYSYSRYQGLCLIITDKSVGVPDKSVGVLFILVGVLFIFAELEPPDIGT